jgi:glycosyltransferase involved in cell wall biosynthesis
LRFLYLAQSFWPTIGGVEISHRRLLEALVARGDEVTVLTSPYPGAMREDESLTGIEIHRFPFRQALEAHDATAVARGIAQVAAIKRRFRPDLVHVAMTDPIGFYHLRSLSAWPAATLVSVHVSIEGLAGGKGGLFSRLVQQADIVVANSHAIAAEILTLNPAAAGRLMCIRPSSMPMPPSWRPPPPGPPRLLFAGRMVPEKGAAVLIAAMPLILSRWPALELVLVGDGPERAALQQAAQDAGVAEACRFLGMVPPDAMPELMAEAHLVVVPSLWKEAFGQVASEAAACGRAVVASRVGGLPEVVLDGETGLLVEPDVPAALASAILRLLDDPGRLRDMGRKARERAGRAFGPATMIEGYRAAHARAIEAFRSR